jgi:hypothetical protein
MRAQNVGDILKFAGKTAPKGEEPNDVDQIMACNECDGDVFVLAADNNIFCVRCEGRVDAVWAFKTPTPAA